MLYVYYGSDTHKARAKLQSTTNSLRTKHPHAHYVRITADTFPNHNLEELTQSQALFKQEYIVVFDSVCGEKEHQETLLSWLSELQKAPHAFFVLEEKVLAPARKKFEKYSDKFQEFEEVGKEKGAEFNNFAMTDALGKKDRKNLWVLFQKSLQSGASPEEIQGILFWMVKSMALASSSNTAEDAQLKPFVFNKARSFAKNYTRLELENKIRVLSTLPQRSRRKSIPLEVALERFVLSV